MDTRTVESFVLLFLFYMFLLGKIKNDGLFSEKKCGEISFSETIIGVQTLVYCT